MARLWSNSVLTDVPIVNAAETAFITSTPVSTGQDFDQITISGSFNILAGASTTAIVVRIRRGNGITGAVVGDIPPVTLAAGASAEIPFQATDTPGAVAGQQYTVSATQTAGTANGTVSRSSITVAVGQP